MVKGASRWVSQQVERLVAALWGAGVYQVPPDPLPPTCYPFVTPKSPEKVFPAIELERLPFGLKYTPYFSQTTLVWVLQGAHPPPPHGMLLVHYLDDFLPVSTDEGVLREAARAVVRALVEAGFRINPKSVFDPVQPVSFPGKAPNVATRTFACHTQAPL